MKQLLACGSVVVAPQNDAYEWWYKLLKPFVHFVPTKNIASAGGRDLPAVHDCLRRNEDEAARIADAARAFARDVLSLDLRAVLAPPHPDSTTALRKGAQHIDPDMGGLRT